MPKKQKYKEVGNRLRSIRGTRNQEAFAGLLDVSKPALQNYEAGLRMPPGEALVKAARIGGTTVDWILCGEDSRNNLRGTFVVEGSAEFEILKAVRALSRGRMRLFRRILKAMAEEDD